jgi:iron complex outermembrane receptor protein
MTKNLLWLSCATSALVLGAVGAAQAATATAEASAAAEAGGTVSELVVVAEHRETALQKIPVAISVFTSAQRDIAGINSVQDVTNFAPGFTYDPGNVHAYIRGVGRQSINVTDDQRVATYEDELYVYSPYNLDKSSLFLSQEQIERGPQSTGGKEAAAGSIDEISVRPTEQPYAEVRGIFGNFSNYNVEAAASGTIAPNLTARLAGFYHNQNDGYYKNLANGVSEGNVIHEWYVEGQFDWKPNDRTEFWVRAFTDGWNNRGDAGARNGFANGSWNMTNLTDANSYPGGALFVNPNFGYEAVNPQARAANANFASLASVLAGQTLAYVPTSASFLSPTIANNPSATNPNTFASILSRRLTLNDYQGIQTNFTYDVTPGIQFRYIAGYQQYKYRLDFSEPDTNVTGFPLGLQTLAGAPFGATLTGAPGLVINPLTNLTYIEDDGWWSHEASLQSIDNGPVQWTVGLFYFHQHYINPIFADAPGQANFGQPITLGSLLAGQPITGPATLAAPNPNHFLFNQFYSVTSEDAAGYGQVSYKFNDQWKITGALRYTYDTKYGYEFNRDVAFGSTEINLYGPLLGAASPSVDVTSAVVCPTGTGVAGSASCFTGPLAKGVVNVATPNSTGAFARSLRGSSDAVTGNAGLEFTPTPDIFMYARYGRGYEPISFNAGFVSANPETKPEFLNSYELGYKQNFGGHLSFDLALFYYDYQQFQVPLAVSTGGVTSTQFINVPKARSDGVELEGVWSPVKDFTAVFSYSYDDTAILTGCSGALVGGVFIANANALCVEDTNDPLAVQPGAKPIASGGAGVVVQSVKGNPLPNAPQNKVALNLAYTWHFDPGSLTLSGAAIWRDTQVGTVFNRFYDTAPSWSDIDIRALWKSHDDKYEIIGYVKNVFNTLQYEVGAAGAGLSGTENQSLVSTKGNGGKLFETSVYTLAPPRTYGLEVRYKFF